MSIIFDKKNNLIYDSRCKDDKLFCGGNISICYTLLSDDISKGKKVSATPYTDRFDNIDFNLEASEKLGAYAKISTIGSGLRFDITYNENDVSEFGVNLPFNFMGKLDGGDFRDQFLFNSVYTSSDGSIIYAYLTKPNGNNLAVAILSPADGWKMDYSPYLWGHFFVNLKLLARYDKAYIDSKNESKISFVILPVTDFESCLSELSYVFDVPFLDYSVGGGKINDSISLYTYGKCDYIIESHKGSEHILESVDKYEIKHSGECTLIPVKNGKKGASVTVYGYESLTKLYKRAMDSVDLDIIKNHTDGNLCEHQCWVSAMLRYLYRFKSTLTSEEVLSYESKVLSQLNIITEQDESKAVPRQTIWHLPHDTFLAYNVYKSKRVQELFFGITILLDAYKYFGDEKYYIYLKNAMECLILRYQDESGALKITWDDGDEDYTTVCCAMIPICDVALYFKDRDEALSKRCFKSAYKMAEYLYNRGLHFPTEGGKTEFATEEMEDGSISCTALALLYFAKNIHYNKKYIDKAREILSLHDSWIIKTPICQMHGSTLRWWETQWEGDADGPAICAGHAWSIWRAEADFLMYELTNEEIFLTKAQNGFMTNLSKIDESGNSYSIYNPDTINGGGFIWEQDKVIFRIAPRFSSIVDCGISRYAFIRINDTLLKNHTK